jgi:phage-related protein
MSDFTYIPSYKTSVSDEYAVDRAEFGDGYVVTAPHGLNPVKETWRLVFENIARTQGDAIRTFLKSRAGQSFTWTPPGAAEKRWRQIGSVSMPFEGPAVVTLQVDLEEVFGAS